VTTQVAAAVAFNVVVAIEQPVPVVVKVSAPLPEPPVALNVIGVPAVELKTVLAITNVVCAAAVKVNVAEADEVAE
jgi:hypothetical protein